MQAQDISSKKSHSSQFVSKRRVVSSACLACRKRKSKCNGELPSCGACASVYGTRCVYDPASDHRRKGVYRRTKAESTSTNNDTCETLVKGILTYPEDEVSALVAKIRKAKDLSVIAKEIEQRSSTLPALRPDQRLRSDSLDQYEDDLTGDDLEGKTSDTTLNIERDLSGKFGHLRIENGAFRFLGGTSNLLYLDYENVKAEDSPMIVSGFDYTRNEDVIKSWTNCTDDVELILHLLQLYFTWHYPYHSILSKALFFRDFFRGKPKNPDTSREFCTPLLVNAMLALGCHFTQWPRARSNPSDPGTAGEHFFKEAKRLVVDNEEFETPRLTTVQALGLMSIREAGCSHEGRGWLYSGISFRMACEMGLHIDFSEDESYSTIANEVLDARRTTFWGCFFIDKCYSNYLGRQPQLSGEGISIPKISVTSDDEGDLWSPRGDQGIDKTQSRPSKTKCVALQISILAEICSDLLIAFYCPSPKQKLDRTTEVKRLSDFHIRLETWLKELPADLQAEEGQLPHILLMHMFSHLLYIHLYRPFLGHTQSSSPLPAKVSPRTICTRAALGISRLLRMYRKAYGLKRIPNIAIYIAHSACSIHLLGLPDKSAQRDIIHGVSSLEEMTDCWPSAARTLATLAIQANRWNIELPAETATTLSRWETKYRNDHMLTRTRAEGDHTHPPLVCIDLAVPTPIAPASGNSTLLEARLDPTNQPAAANLAEPMSGLAYQQQLPASQLQPVINASHLRDMGSSTPRLESQAFNSRFYPTLPLANGTANISGHGVSIEEPNEWWYRDQSSIYENWSRRESTAEHGNANGYSLYSDSAVPSSVGLGYAAYSLASNPMDTSFYQFGNGATNNP